MEDECDSSAEDQAPDQVRVVDIVARTIPVVAEREPLADEIGAGEEIDIVNKGAHCVCKGLWLGL